MYSRNMRHILETLKALILALNILSICASSQTYAVDMYKYLEKRLLTFENAETISIKFREW